MQIIDTYIEPSINIEGTYNHVALEALLRAIEDDVAFIGNRRIDLIDIRAMSALESVCELRDLIRREEFMLDLNKLKSTLASSSVSYTTPYDRIVKRSWSTNHHMVETEKGWVVFDYVVETQVSN